MTQSLKELLSDLFDNPTYTLGDEDTCILHSLMYCEKDDFIHLTENNENYANIYAEYIDSYGGEGKGSDYWSVYKFIKGEEEAIVKFSGYYQSYCGAEFEEWGFVKPEQVTITVFVPE